MADITVGDYSVRLCDPRYIHKSMFNNNEIRTTKYTLLTFVPFCTLYQFKRLANLYFLLTAIVQCIPQISPLDPFTAVGPLLLVLFIALLKEAYEDYKRRRNDKAINSSLAVVFREGNWVTVAWRDVHLGDLMRIADGETFPADLVLLVTSESDGSAKVQTANLDGERNLKTKQAGLMTMAAFEQGKLRENANLTFWVGMPDDRFEAFDGYVADGQGETRSLGPKQLVLRVRLM